MRGAARAVALAATLLVAGCVTPAPDHGAYLQNAKSALESAVSETAAARLAVQARLDGRSTNAFADTVVTDSEKALAPVEASFGGVDPPAPEDDTLRTSTLEHLGAASEALAEARVAIRRDEPGALRDAEAALAEAVDELERAREDLE